jgi:hypothetical protein
MKYLIALFSFCLAAFAVKAQDPVSWSTSAVKKAAGLYEVTITATVEKPWHIYSQKTPPGGGNPTRFTFKKNPLLTLDGSVKEVGTLKTEHDEVLKVDVKYYAGKVDFVQLVKVKGAAKTNLSATVDYMVCNDERCLPPTKKTFDIKLQ